MCHEVAPEKAVARAEVYAYYESKPAKQLLTVVFLPADTFRRACEDGPVQPRQGPVVVVHCRTPVDKVWWRSWGFAVWGVKGIVYHGLREICETYGASRLEPEGRNLGEYKEASRVDVILLRS